LLLHGLKKEFLPISPIKIVILGNFVAGLLICAGVFSGSALVVAILTFVMGFSNGTSIPIVISVCCSDNDCNTILPANVINISLYAAFFACPLVIGALASYSSLSAGMYLGAFFTLLAGLMALLYRRMAKSKQSADR